MLVIGEKINSSRKEIYEAILSRNESFLRQLAKTQTEAGADYIDVNAGAFLEDEEALLVWLVQIVQQEIDRPLCLDSPNPKAIEKAIQVHKGIPLINSISLEENRYRSMISLVKESGSKVVGLCMGDGGIPKTGDERIAVAENLISRLTGDGVPLDHVFLDPLVQPLAVDCTNGRTGLNVIRQIRTLHPEIHIICGLSNLSHGLPSRKFINRVFLQMAVASGLDAAILDPLDRVLMTSLQTANLLMGEDEFCLKYIQAHRGGKFEGLS